MKGRSSFTADEIDEIRDLLRRKAKAARSAQKSIRAQIRQRGFYISDFGGQGEAFTEKDLDRLIRSGRIAVTGEYRHTPWWRRFGDWWRQRLGGSRETSPVPHTRTQSRVLTPILADDLDVVFVGTEPGPTSMRVGHYFANPDNSFYRDLHAVGLTPRVLSPNEDRGLLEHGIGLDDVYDDPEGLRRRLEQARPLAVCFDSKGALERFVGHPVEVWRGSAAARSADLPISLVWAVPDSSPRADRHRSERLRLLRELVVALDEDPK